MCQFQALLLLHFLFLSLTLDFFPPLQISLATLNGSLRIPLNLTGFDASVLLIWMAMGQFRSHLWTQW